MRVGNRTGLALRTPARQDWAAGDFPLLGLSALAAAANNEPQAHSARPTCACAGCSAGSLARRVLREATPSSQQARNAKPRENEDSSARRSSPSDEPARKRASRKLTPATPVALVRGSGGAGYLEGSRDQPRTSMLTPCAPVALVRGSGGDGRQKGGKEQQRARPSTPDTPVALVRGSGGDGCQEGATGAGRAVESNRDRDRRRRALRWPW